MKTTREPLIFDPESAEDPSPGEIVFGLTLAGADGRTTLCVLEKNRAPGAPQLDVLNVQRWAPRTAFPRIVEAVRRVLAMPESRPFLDILHPSRRRHQVERFHAPPPKLIIDGSQAGPAVVELFLRAGLAGELSVAKVTGGTEASEQRWPRLPDVPYFHVARIALVAAIQASLQAGRLSFHQSMAERSALIAELGGFTSKAVARDSEDFVAQREGDGDDISIALGLAVWLADRPPPPAAHWGGHPLGDDWF